MTPDLLGMELLHAENLLAALNKSYRVVYYYAKKPLTDTDSVRVIRQRDMDGRIELTVSAFKTKIEI